MNVSKSRPVHLTIGNKVEDTDDERTPEYPLSDDHPLSLHNRTMFLNTRTSVPLENNTCETGTKIPSQISPKPLAQLEIIDPFTLGQCVSRGQCVLLHQNKTSCQDKQNRSSNIHTDHALYQTCTKTSMLEDITEVLDLANGLKISEHHYLKDGDVSLLARSLLDVDLRFGNDGVRSAGRNGSTNKKMYLSTECKKTQRMSMGSTLFSDALIDTNNNSGENHNLHHLRNQRRLSNSMEGFPSNKPTSSGYSDEVCKRKDGSTFELIANKSRNDPDEKNVPPQLSPVIINVNLKYETPANSQNLPFPPTLSPMIKVETPVCSVDFENLSTPRQESSSNAPPKDRVSETVDSEIREEQTLHGFLEKMPPNSNFQCTSIQAGSINAHSVSPVSNIPSETTKGPGDQKNLTKIKTHSPRKENEDISTTASKGEALSIPLQKDLDGLFPTTDHKIQGPGSNCKVNDTRHNDFGNRESLRILHNQLMMKKAKAETMATVSRNRPLTVCITLPTSTISSQMHLCTDAKTVASGKSYLCYPYSVQNVCVGSGCDKTVRERMVGATNPNIKTVSSDDIVTRSESTTGTRTLKNRMQPSPTQVQSQGSLAMTITSSTESSISPSFNPRVVSTFPNFRPLPRASLVTLHSSRSKSPNFSSMTHAPQFASSMLLSPLLVVSAPEKALMQATTYEASASSSLPTTTMLHNDATVIRTTLSNQPPLSKYYDHPKPPASSVNQSQSGSRAQTRIRENVCTLGKDTTFVPSTNEPAKAKLHENSNTYPQQQGYASPSQIKIPSNKITNKTIVASSAEDSSLHMQEKSIRTLEVNSPLRNISRENGLPGGQPLRTTNQVAISNLKVETFETVNAANPGHISYRSPSLSASSLSASSLSSSPLASSSSSSSCAPTLGQSEPLDLSSRQLLSYQKITNQNTAAKIPLSKGSSQPSAMITTSKRPNPHDYSVTVESNELLESNMSSKHNVESSSVDNKEKTSNSVAQNNDFETRSSLYSVFSMPDAHGKNTETEFRKSPRVPTIQTQEGHKELSLLHQPNVVFDIEDDEYELPSLNSSIEKQRSKEFPVKKYLSSDPDEKSYSYLAYNAITSKRKKSPSSYKIPTENEDFLDFLRRDASSSSKKPKSVRGNSSAPSTNGLGHGEIIDLTDETGDVFSISSDEPMEDMERVLETDFMHVRNDFEPSIDNTYSSSADSDIKENVSKISRQETERESVLGNYFLHARQDIEPSMYNSFVDSNTKDNLSKLSEEEAERSPTMLIPAHGDNINSTGTHFESSFAFELERQVYPACRKPSSVLDASELYRIKEQTLTFSRPQKALMAKRIQDIISRHSRLLPEGMHPSKTLLMTPEPTDCGRSYMPISSQQTISPNHKHETEESYRLRAEYIGAHSNETGRLSEDIISSSPREYGGVWSSALDSPGSMAISNIAKGCNLDMDDRKIPSNERSYLETGCQTLRNNETGIEADTPYKTVWQTRFITEKEANEATGIDNAGNNLEDQDIVQRLQLMRSASNRISQVADSDISRNSVTSSSCGKKRRRRSVTKRVNQADNGLNSAYPDREPAPYPANAHIDIQSPHPPDPGQLNPFIPSPFVVAPYYAMAYPLCYPTFQGVPTSNQSILLSPHTAALDATDNRHRRCNGRKRTRRAKPPLSGPAKPKRPRNIRRNKRTKTDDKSENISKEIVRKSSDPPFHEDEIHPSGDLVIDTEADVSDKSNPINADTTDPVRVVMHEEGGFQELRGFESERSSYLLQTRKEDGMTVLSMRKADESIANNTGVSISDGVWNNNPFFQASCRVDLDLLNSYPIAPTSNLEIHPTTVASSWSSSGVDLISASPQKHSAMDSFGQNLNTLALASEKHEKMANHGPVPASDVTVGSHSDAITSNLNGNNVTLSPQMNVHLDETRAFLNPNESMNQTQTPETVLDESTNSTSKKMMHGITEKEKLVTEMLAAMMHTRNLGSGEEHV